MNSLAISLIFGIILPIMNASDITTKDQAQQEENGSVAVVYDFTGEVTAYTSREAETDDSPFITASNKRVRWGIVATNAYPFGTQVRFPDIYGDEIFVVEDRMNARYTDHVDIWFPDYYEAKQFGRRKTRVQIVEEDKSLTLAE